MKLNNLVMRGGVLVILLSLLVVGCKQPDSSGDPDWTVNESKQKVWKKTNNSATQFARAFEQFGTTKNVKEAVVKLTVGDMSASKAGLVFAYNDYTTDGAKKKYFLLGIGGHGYNVGTNNGEYFLSYYENVELAALSGSYDNENPTGTHYSCINNTEISSPVTVIGKSVSLYASVSETAKEGDDTTKVVTINLGNAVSADKKSVENPVVTLNFEIGSNASNPSLGADAQKFLRGLSTIQGGIGAYGMVTKAVGGEKSTENKYEVSYTDALRLHAE